MALPSGPGRCSLSVGFTAALSLVLQAEKARRAGGAFQLKKFHNDIKRALINKCACTTTSFMCTFPLHQCASLRTARQATSEAWDVVSTWRWWHRPGLRTEKKHCWTLRVDAEETSESGRTPGCGSHCCSLPCALARTPPCMPTCHDDRQVGERLKTGSVPAHAVELCKGH